MDLEEGGGGPQRSWGEGANTIKTFCVKFSNKYSIFKNNEDIRLPEGGMFVNSFKCCFYSKTICKCYTKFVFFEDFYFQCLWVLCRDVWVSAGSHGANPWSKNYRKL